MKEKSLFPSLRNSYPTLKNDFIDVFGDFWSDLDKMWAEQFSGIRTKAYSTFDVAEKGYVLTIELPGVLSSEIAVEKVADTLKIKAEQKQQEGKSYFSFVKQLTVPKDADDENIEASLKDGILTITLPRKKEEKKLEQGVKIPIKG